MKSNQTKFLSNLFDRLIVEHLVLTMKAYSSLKKGPSAGFTLLELLVVIAMVGILAAVAAPSWLGFMSNQRRNTVENALVQTLKLSQQDAIQKRQRVMVTIKEGETLPTINNGIDRNLADGTGIKPGMVSLDSYYVDSAGVKQQRDVIYFDYRGKPVHVNNGVEVPPNLPFVVSVTSQNSNNQKCVIIANLIGSIKTAEGATCDNPGVVPVDPT